MVVQQVAKLTAEQELAALRAENALLKKQVETTQVKGVSFKVSDKGCVSASGLNSFPVSLYKQQWQKVCTAGPVIDFIVAHEAEIDAKAAAWLAKPESERATIDAANKAKFAASVASRKVA